MVQEDMNSAVGRCTDPLCPSSGQCWRIPALCLVLRPTLRKTFFFLFKPEKSTSRELTGAGGRGGRGKHVYHASLPKSKSITFGV